MIVGFLNNQIDNRGTGNAIYDYAHYNEEILHNESRILTLDTATRNDLMVRRLLDRFEKIYQPDETECDVIYHIKYGNDDGWRPTASKLGRSRYVVHAVFDGSQPHGDRFAVISHWLSRQNLAADIPVVPHIIDMPWPDQTQAGCRQILGIPPKALVFGRYGGFETFDIDWVWESIRTVLDIRDDVYFLFMNTDIKFDHPHIISLPETGFVGKKRDFIYACDAMLHARQRGETFGISVLEFDVLGRALITFGDSPEGAHYEEVWGPTLYFSQEGLIDILLNWEKIDSVRPFNEYHYNGYTPDNVMHRFKRVFLD